MSLTNRCRPSADVPARLVAPEACRAEFGLRMAFTHGGVADFTLRYELIGRDEAPILLVAGGISAGRHVVASDKFPEAGWWQAQSPSFDLAQWQVLAIDWVGADGAVDSPIDPSDQAEAIARLLDALGVERIAGFVGASYGAMVGLHFAARHPGRCGALLAISASGAAHPFSSACRSLQRRALALGEELGDPASGVALARAMAMLTYRTPDEFADRFAALPEVVNARVRVAADDYLDAHGKRHVRRMSATAYRRLSESIDLHRIDAAAVRVPVTMVAVDSDALVPPADVEAFARAIPGAAFHCIPSRYGHDAFLKEDAAIAATLSTFLTSLEPAR